MFIRGNVEWLHARVLSNVLSGSGYSKVVLDIIALLNACLLT